MAFKKGGPRPARSGRKRGTPNKATAAVKDTLLAAFDQIGGVAALAKWARASPRNRAEFYKLWAKLLPVEVKASVVGSIALELVEEIIDGRSTAAADGPASDDPPAPGAS